MHKFFLFLFVSMLSSLSMAGQVQDGVYGQTSASQGVGDCSSCEVRVVKQSPHIIQLSSNNGWIGFATYHQQDDRYKGVFEWQIGKGGAYEGVVFSIDMIYEGQTLTMNARSNVLNFSVTYRKK